MLSFKIIKEASIKQMTTEINISREYLQLLFLENFYQQKGAEKLLFKGGTALRLIYGSPRFSTDLDFDGDGASIYEIENLLQETLIEINREEKIELKEAKKTTGGYLAKISSVIARISLELKLEISLRVRKQKLGELITVASNFLPPFTIYAVKKDNLIRGKINALLSRVKPRDYYDLYFLLRKFFNLQLTAGEKEKICQKVKHLDEINIRNELKSLLPKSHHLILRNFKKTLLNELERFGAQPACRTGR